MSTTPIDLFDPRRLQPFRPSMQLATTMPEDQALLTPPQNYGPMTGSPQAEPPVDLDQELAPYRQHEQQADQALQGGLDQLTAMQYPHTSAKRIIGGWLAGQVIPQLGEHIINEPTRKYMADVTRSKYNLSALENAARIAERDLQTAQQHQQQRAAIGWYNRRQPITDARTIEVMDPTDGMIHLKQFNPETTRFDIDAGLAGKQAPEPKEPKTSDIDLFQSDPAAFDRYINAKERARPKYDRSNKPTEAEFRYNLYKRDPKAYRAMYGRRDSQFEGQAWMRAFQGAKDELGEIDFPKAQKLHDDIMGGYNADYGDDSDNGAEPQVSPIGPVSSHGPAMTPPATNSSTSGQGVRYYQGHPYKLVGGQYVRQD